MSVSREMLIAIARAVYRAGGDETTLTILSPCGRAWLLTSVDVLTACELKLVPSNATAPISASPAQPVAASCCRLLQPRGER